MNKPTRFPIINAFLAAFLELPLHEREEVIGEMEGLCSGYREGKEDAWRDNLQVDGDQILSNISAQTLANIMNDLKIRRHRRGRVTVRPS